MALVALLTDFGLADTYVAEMKAALLRSGPSDLRLLDVTHAVPPGDVAAGRWALRRIWPQLPGGAVALAVVDPGVGTARPAVAARAGGRWYVGPGNGLAGFLADEPGLAVWRLTHPSPPGGFTASMTFHGRDLFAPAAAMLAGGGDPGDLGPAGGCGDLGLATATAGEGAVVWIDRFGNLITDLRRDGPLAGDLAAGAVVETAGRVVRGPVDTFADGAEGEPIWYWGSGDTLEVAVRGASAAAALGAQVGLAIHLRRP